MSSSCSPSSSAVTIPIPGKSILKKPPPAQPSIFSRITRFLPSPSQSQPPAVDESKPLKRAHFILPQIATVYPISSINPPSTPTLKDEKKAIEDREAERRRRVVRGNSLGPGETEVWWNLEKVESFYRECCEGTEESPDVGITAAFKRAAGTNPRTLDLSGVQLTAASAGILSDVFTIEWGLRKLVLRECDLDEHALKPVLHALLIPGTLTFLSVASNRRLKTASYRLIGAYLAKSESLQFLDLSQNFLDKKSVEDITASLATPPNQGLLSLRLDDCSLRSAALEVLARAVRTSSLRNISLRHNRITATGAVALALMIRDYPDVVPATPPTSTLPLSPMSSVASQSPPSTPTTPTSSILSNFSSLPPANPRTGSVLPPPRHPPVSPQTTYTPYIPRKTRRVHQPAPLLLSPSGHPVPLITSSSQGGVTTRHPVHSPLASGGPIGDGQAEASLRHALGPSAALLDKVRALDALPRLGALRTLDLKGNDLRTGISYIAQVLKRNRTLKVLNLSENKLDVPCLIAIAEALKYNSCLETLDLSKNPCSGPGLEGIQSLRTAFTLNTALKRLFLSSTSMTSPGAIALAEFLPESTSLLHLDLTLNDLDIAGVMALSSGLKANHTMRCLDLNIPPGDEDFARMCRDILNSCVRNTEEAEKGSHVTSSAGESGRGRGKGIWGMIEESKLARTIRDGEKEKMNSDIVHQARGCVEGLKHVLAMPSSERTSDLNLVANQASTLIRELTRTIEATTNPRRLQELLQVNDELIEISAKVPQAGRPVLKLQGLGLSGENLQLLSGDRHSGSNANGTVLYENGQAIHDSPIEDDGEPTTPRLDKGKAKAEPEPEEPEKVLSPSLLISEDEDEDDGSRPILVVEVDDRPSPTDRSKSWVEEEGEVFRKGTQLLRPEDFEADYAGEDLRKELLEAMVDRPPPRPFIEEYNMEVEQEGQSPVVASEETKKPPPRPYMSRSRSSSSNSLVPDILSPTSPSAVQVNDSPVTTPTLPNGPAALGVRPYLVRKQST